MTENKNLNHTFSSDVNMPLYLIRLYPLNDSVTDFFFLFFFFFFRFLFVCLFFWGFFFVFFFGVCVWGGGGRGGGLWSYIHHTVDVKILCSDVVRPSGCPFIF